MARQARTSSGTAEAEASVRVEPYRQYNDVQLITIEVRIDGSRKRIVHRQLVECAE